MSSPSRAVRAATYSRDRGLCVAASAECFGRIEWNHRESGTRGRKAPPVTVADGVTMCASHNQRIEGDLISEGLANGWKIKSFRGGFQAFDLPYYDRTDRAWYLPLDLERADPLVPMLALELLDAAGSLTRTLTP